MLLLLFELGQDRYALDAAQVAQVLPLVRIKRVPQAPAGVVGVFQFRGKPVPVVDLSLLALGRPAQQLLSTRIILVHYPDDHGGSHLLGLIAENATSTLRQDAAQFVPTGIANEAAPYLGAVAADGSLGGMVQRIDVKGLLPPAVRSALFRQVQGAE